jgi:hypothetical protein
MIYHIMYDIAENPYKNLSIKKSHRTLSGSFIYLSVHRDRKRVATLFILCYDLCFVEITCSKKTQELVKIQFVAYQFNKSRLEHFVQGK